MSFKEKILNKKSLLIYSALLLIGASIFLTFIKYDYIITYSGKAWKKLCDSAVFFWENLVGRFIENEVTVAPSDTSFSFEVKNINFNFIDFSSFDIDKIEFKFEHLWEGMKNGSNFQLYNLYFVYYLLFAILYITVGICILTIIRALFEVFFYQPRNNPGEKSKPLALFQRYIEIPLKKVLGYLSEVMGLIWNNSWLKFAFCLIWAFNFNIINFGMEFFSWYFTFPFAPSLKGIINLISTFIVDFMIMLYSAPWWIWVILFGKLFDNYRTSFADARLYHDEAHAKGVVKESSRDWIIVAPIRTGKDYIMTYIALIAETVFHGMSYDSIFKFKRMYPDFPWWKLERDLDLKIKNRTIYGPFSGARYISKLREMYIRSGNDNQYIYGYEGRMFFCDALRYCDIWDDLQEYAKVYFVYSVDTSLIYSLSPIRTDIKLESFGNFPIWDENMLGRTPDDFEPYTRYCHNTDLDSFRYGKHYEENNKNIGQFVFGISVRSEWDKEKGNQITNAYMRYDDEEANPLNDKMSIGQKMLGHASTYDFQTYYLTLANCQRPSSLMADDLELRDKFLIADVEKNKSALPLYFEKPILDFLTGFYKDFDKNVCFYGREQFTLFTYILNHFFSFIHNYGYRRDKRYGYHSYIMYYEKAGMHDRGEERKIKINVPKRVIEDERYATDFFALHFDELADENQISILDVPEFQGKYPTDQERAYQHSRLNRDMDNIKKKNRG